uniref:Cytochrome b/b6 C-terminal region profile domain-containing protein n=1 Tax=Nelumbo nucifera TaxID=4432 RepID=A0A822ZNM8_NELNU|nr:TPA_asm: hypothetical protein HUJ06_004300 [Nelumbo nucifera]
MIGEPADPFATPLEILPEWYFFPVFQILRTVPNKLLGVLLMVSVPAGLLTVPFLENVNKFQNPFRRPVATTVFLIGIAVALWLGIGAPRLYCKYAVTNNPAKVIGIRPNTIPNRKTSIISICLKKEKREVISIPKY